MDENNENLTEQEEKEAEAFNSMLNAAQKKLGINPEEAPAEGEAAPAGSEAPAEGEEAPADGEKKSKLTQAQIEALLGDDEGDGSAAPAEGVPATADNAQAPAAADAAAEGGAPAEAPANGEEGEAGEPDELDDDDDTDEIASILGASINSSAQEEAPAPAEPEKPKKNMLGFIITIAAVVVALALGFCVSMLMFSDIIKTGNENFAIRAANAVNSKLPLNSELYVFRSYVKNGASDTECMLYYAVCYGGDINTDMCKVSVTRDKPHLVNIYYTVDEDSPEYIAMKQSDDAEVRLQASFLKNYSDSVRAADKLIQIDSPQWEKVDCTKINRNITSKQDKNAAPAQTSAPAQNEKDIADIADIEE